MRERLNLKRAVLLTRMTAPRVDLTAYGLRCCWKQTAQQTLLSAGSSIEAAQRQRRQSRGFAGFGERDSLPPIVLRQQLEHSTRRERTGG